MYLLAFTRHALLLSERSMRTSGASAIGHHAPGVRRMTYGEFWFHYLRAHQRTGTRRLHYVSSVLALALVAAAAIYGDWRLLPGAVVVGCGLAWIGHFAVEGNRPVTFGYPVWSLVSDYRTLLMWLTGGLGPHLV